MFADFEDESLKWVRLPDGRVYTAPCDIRAKWPSERHPHFENNYNLNC